MLVTNRQRNEIARRLRDLGWDFEDNYMNDAIDSLERGEEPTSMIGALAADMLREGV